MIKYKKSIFDRVNPNINKKNNNSIFKRFNLNKGVSIGDEIVKQYKTIDLLKIKYKKNLKNPKNNEENDLVKELIKYCNRIKKAIDSKNHIEANRLAKKLNKKSKKLNKKN